jgi:regulator of sigma E protease
MNFLAGVLILVCLYSGAQAYYAPVIASFLDGCPAAEQGYLQAGDEILKIDGHAVWQTTDVSLLLGRGNGETADLVIRRDGERLTLKDVPLALHEYELDGTTVWKYGLNFSAVPSSLTGNLKLALGAAADFARTVWFSLEDLISGAAGLRDLSGPIGIVDTMSEVGESSATVWDAVLNLLYFGSFIAINLAVMNLLPIPALDGGRLLFLVLNVLLHRLFHREIPGKYEGYVHLAGMAVLLLLMLVVGINDVFKLFWS